MATTTGGDKVQKQVKDPVSQMKIHRECLLKQTRNQKLYEDFMINEPKNVKFYSEKPNNNSFLLMKYRNEGRTIKGVDIDQKLDDQMQKTNLTEQISDKLKTLTHVPKDKWAFPQTSNQQIGWYSQNADGTSKFVHKRKACNETNYADNYYTLKHTSLFSNANQK